MQVLSTLVGLGALVCWILVLIKMFKKEGVLLGILGIICALWTLIWGIINHKKEGITNLMLIWIILIIISIVLNQAVGVKYPFMTQ